VIVAGDPSGVGPELLIRVLGVPSPSVPAAHASVPATHASVPGVFPDLTIVSDMGLLLRVGKALVGADPKAKSVVDRFFRRLERGQIRFEQTTAKPRDAAPGRWSPAQATFVIESLDRSIDICRREGRRLVTGPSNKLAFASVGKICAGHTELLHVRLGGGEPLMLFDSPRLRVGVMTRHIPLSQVTAAVSYPLLERSVALTCRYLDSVEGPGWSARGPLAIAGLDPHCGEWGAFSQVDSTVRAWVERLSASIAENALPEPGGEASVPVVGPLPADTLFSPAKLDGFSAALCWYHDQGMIPVKLLAFDTAVNVTLGLPVQRFSPAHGPAYDIAWSGKALPGSFRRAVFLALR